jgi:putative transposase
VQLLFSRPGKPTDNPSSEAFNASVRRECLSAHYFSTLAEAAVVLGAYRAEYNKVRPHSSLGQLTPAAFRAGLEINAEGTEGSKRVA